MKIDRNQLDSLDSSDVTTSDVTTGERLRPIHPGEILRDLECFKEPQLQAFIPPLVPLTLGKRWPPP